MMNLNQNPNHTPPPPPPTTNSTPNSATPRANRPRRRADLTLPIPHREPPRGHPLPLPPSNSAPSTSHHHHYHHQHNTTTTTTTTTTNNNNSNSHSDPHRSLQQRINFTQLERVNRIGSGSGGTVYKVFHRPSGRHFALKVIYGHHDESILKQILREVEIVRGVNNPNVVKCHDVSDHGGEIQVLLEYMDEGSLEGIHIQNEKQLSHLTYQILSGLAYLHRSKIVHRDIKPSNLLVNSKKQVKIADFGVSRVLSQTMDPCNSSVGTIAYMSPERINTDLNHGRYDGYAGDIWSFGVSILEFYLGRFPFAVGRGGDWASLMCAICLSDPPEAPLNASREFRSFISCCLQRDPSNRWTAAGLLGHPFIVNHNPQAPQPNLRKLLPPPPPVSS